MHALRNASVIAANDVRRRMRNRSFVLQAFVGPIVLATIISLAFGGGIDLGMKIGVVDADGSEIGEAFQGRLAEASGAGIEFVVVETEAEARASIDDVDLTAAVVIPEGFGASLADPEPRPIEIITRRDLPSGQMGAEIARSVASGLAARIEAARLGVAASLALDLAAPSGAALRSVDLPVDLQQRSSGDELSPAAHFGPGMGLLFLFLSMGLVARTLLQEHQERVLDRIRAAPVTVAQLLAGKCASLVILSAISLTVIWIATSVLLGAEWGDPAAVLVLIGASSLATAGLAGVVACIVRSEQTADAVAMAIALVLSLVGGNMLPLSDLPDALRSLSRLTPNGWALIGFAELSAAEGGISDIVPHLGVLLGWAVVTGAIAALVLPKRLAAR